MGFLANKRILITGMISTRSIAYGIAQAMHREGAELAFTYQGERVLGRVEDMAKKFGSDMIYQCDVSRDDDINQLFIDLGKRWDGFDGFVHAIAFAPREALAGEFLDNFSREAFRIAHDISAYSFPAMAKAALPMMEGRNASLLTLTYLGAVRTMPHYNVMGMAKASLEASVRYLAMRLGRSGIRERHLRGRSKCPKQKESPIAADRQIQPHLTGHSRGLTGPPPNKKATLGWLFVGLCKIKAVLSLFRANSP